MGWSSPIWASTSTAARPRARASAPSPSATARLVDGELIRLRDAQEKGIPCGLAISEDGRRLYIANVWGQSVGALDLMAKKPLFDLKLTTAAPTIVVPPAQPLDDDTAAATKRAEAARIKTMADAPFPYACALDEARDRLYVSLWAQAAIAVIDLTSRTVARTIAVEDHPNELLLSPRAACSMSPTPTATPSRSSIPPPAR